MLTNNLSIIATKEANSPVLNTLKAIGSFVDNALSESCQQLGFFKLVAQLQVQKKLGADVSQILFVIFLAPVTKVNSTWAFCCEFLNNFGIGKKEVIYRFCTERISNGPTSFCIWQKSLQPNIPSALTTKTLAFYSQPT